MRVKLVSILVVLLFSSHLHAAQNLKIITFNIWGLKGLLLKKPERIAEIEKAINNSGADIVALQEVFNEKITYKMLRLPNYPYYIQGPGRLAYQLQKSGLVILSKHPIEKRVAYRFSSCSFPNCLEPKGTVMAKISLPSGKKLNLFNSHLAATNATSVRTNQVQELLNLIDKNSQNELTIAVGDFNSDTGSAPIELMKSKMEDAYMTYVERHPELSEREKRGLTWDGKNNPNTGGNSRSGRNKHERLDYIFIRAGQNTDINVTKAKVIFDSATPVGFLSDHYAVEANFLIN